TVEPICSGPTQGKGRLTRTARPGLEWFYISRQQERPTTQLLFPLRKPTRKNYSATDRQIRGSCHCGNIRFALLWPDSGPNIPVCACGCSFCTKHRAAWTSHPGGRFELRIAAESQVKRYQFGTKTADFVWVGRTLVRHTV